MRETFGENTYGIVKRLKVIREWLQQLRISGGPATVLDYGCGTGELITHPLALDGYNVLGVDLHAPSIQLAQTRYRLPNLAFRAASIETLLKEGCLFDAIVCSEVLEHLERPQHFLSELKRLLEPEGLLIVTTPNGFGSYEWLCAAQRMLQKTGIHQLLRSFTKAKGDGGPSSAGFLNQESVHVQFFGLKALEAIFRENGFMIADRRARTLICGPYADVVLDAVPFRTALIQWNASVADRLPLRCAADWMFLLHHRKT